MKYQTELEIDLPRERVVELFDDPDNLLEWQPGLRSHEHLSGEPGQPGAKARLIYDERNRQIEMIETVTLRNLPDEFAGSYEAKGVMNWISNRFEAIAPEKTRWIIESEFKFNGFMRIAAAFMRGAFRRQTLDLMHKFKEFAERS